MTNVLFRVHPENKNSVGFGIFRGYRKVNIGQNWLNKHSVENILKISHLQVYCICFSSFFEKVLHFQYDEHLWCSIVFVSNQVLYISFLLFVLFVWSIVLCYLGIVFFTFVDASLHVCSSNVKFLNVNMFLYLTLQYRIRSKFTSNLLNTPFLFTKPIKCQFCPHVETSQLICFANQLTGFYMKATLGLNGLNVIV